MRSDVCVVATVFVALLSACSSKSGAPSASASASAATRGQGVVVDKEGTWLDGKRVADAPGTAARKIEGLYVAARDKRKATGTDGPATEAMAVSLPSETTCGAGMSVLQTLMFSGYPKAKIDFGGKSHDVAMAVPSLEPKEGPDAHVALSATGAVLHLDPCLASYDEVPVAKASEATKTMTGGKLNQLLLTCDAGVSFSDVLALYDATQPAKGLSGDGGCRPPPDDAPKPLEPVPLPEKWKGIVRLGAVSTGGALDAETVKAAEAKIHDKVTGCYAAAVATNRNLQGDVSGTFVIGKKGEVVSIESVELRPDVPGFSGCVRNVIAKWTFPASNGVTTATVPIMFAPE